MFEGLGTKNTQFGTRLRAKADIGFPVQFQGGATTLYPTQIGAAEAQSITNYTLRKGARNDLLGLKFFLGPEGHDIPESVRLDLVAR